MSDALLPSLRRALAVLILLLLPVLLWLAVAQPLIALVADRQDQIDTLSQRLAHLQATIRRIPILERNEAANRLRLETAGGVWQDTNEAAMAAIMQDRLSRAVRGSAGVVKSTSHLRGADEGDLQTVRIRFSVEGTLDTVQQTLAMIEAVRPAIFVDNLTISAPANFVRDKPPLLGLDLEVIGYLQNSQP